MDVRGGRLQSVWRVSPCFFSQFATIVRSPLTLRAVPRVATLSGWFLPVRMLQRPASPASPAGPACPAYPASGHEG